MVKTKKEISKVLFAGLGITCLALGGAGGLLLNHNSGYDVGFADAKATIKPEVKTVYQDVEVEVPVEVIKEVEVEVDNGKLQEVLQYVLDEKGNVNYLVDDLEDDEASLIADRMYQTIEIKKLAVDQVKADLFDELDKTTVTMTDLTVFTLDEDDMERLKINDEFDEVEMLDSDFEDGDFSVKVTGKFEQDDKKFNFEAELSFKDGEFDEFDNFMVSERV